MNGANLVVAALERADLRGPGEENLDVVEALRRSTIELAVTAIHKRRPARRPPSWKQIAVGGERTHLPGREGRITKSTSFDLLRKICHDRHYQF